MNIFHLNLHYLTDLELDLSQICLIIKLEFRQLPVLAITFDTCFEESSL